MSRCPRWLRGRAGWPVRTPPWSSRRRPPHASGQGVGVPAEGFPHRHQLQDGVCDRTAGVGLSRVAFYFVAKLVGPAGSSRLARYGGQYFPFAVVGHRRDAILHAGPADVLHHHPPRPDGRLSGGHAGHATRPGTVILCSSIYSFTMKTFHVALVFAVAWRIRAQARPGPPGQRGGDPPADGADLQRPGDILGRDDRDAQERRPVRVDLRLADLAARRGAVPGASHAEMDAGRRRRAAESPIHWTRCGWPCSTVGAWRTSGRRRSR